MLDHSLMDTLLLRKTRAMRAEDDFHLRDTLSPDMLQFSSFNIDLLHPFIGLVAVPSHGFSLSIPYSNPALTFLVILIF